jgi:hypothetical protein
MSYHTISHRGKKRKERKRKDTEMWVYGKEGLSFLLTLTGGEKHLHRDHPRYAYMRSLYSIYPTVASASGPESVASMHACMSEREENKPL